jgi:type IV secretory pathway VirB3-like protein
MEKQATYQLEWDDLAVGLTRPPLFMGVTLPVGFLTLMLGCLAYVYTQTVYVFPMFGLWHLITVRLSLKEPYFLSLYWKWIHQTPPVPNYAFWGGCNSYEAA